MEKLISKRKIKLMFIIDFIYSNTGGTENQLIKLVNNLNHDKYDVHLLCLRETDWIRKNRDSLECSVSSFNYNCFNHKDPRNFLVFIKTVRHIREIQPDIVLTFFRASNILGVLASRMAGIRNILTSRRDYGLWLDRRVMPLLKLTNHLTAGIITNSHKVKDLTAEKERYDPQKIHVNYNGIDLDSFGRSHDTNGLRKQLDIPESHRIVGCIANLRPMKKHMTLLRAAERVLKKFPEVTFILIGDGPERERIESNISNVGLPHHIKVLGSQHDVLPFLSIMDIGVNCSTSEGLSNAIMEYMASGLPCIVSEAGGNEELIENNVTGLTFPLDDDHQLSEQILSLLKNPAKTARFSIKAREKLASLMNIDSMIERYDNIFDNLYNDTKEMP